MGEGELLEQLRCHYQFILRDEIVVNHEGSRLEELEGHDRQRLEGDFEKDENKERKNVYFFSYE